MKPLLPTLREKKRYLVFEVLSKSRIKAFNEVAKAIIKSYHSFSGDLGLAKAGVMIMPDKWNENKQRGMISANHSSVNELRAGMLFVNNINNQPASIRTVGLSGIMNKASKKYIAG